MSLKLLRFCSLSVALTVLILAHFSPWAEHEASTSRVESRTVTLSVAQEVDMLYLNAIRNAHSEASLFAEVHHLKRALKQVEALRSRVHDQAIGKKIDRRLSQLRHMIHHEIANGPL